MTKNVSVDTKSTQEKEKNINKEKNKEYEAMRDIIVHAFKFFKDMKKKINKNKINTNINQKNNKI